MIRAASDWRHDDLQASFHDDRVYFSVAQALTSDDDVRPLIDANPVKPLATPIIAAITLPTLYLEAQVPVRSSPACLSAKMYRSIHKLARSS